jgi:hypothetical protein
VNAEERMSMCNFLLPLFSLVNVSYRQAIGDLEVPPVTASILDGDDSKP